MATSAFRLVFLVKFLQFLKELMRFKLNSIYNRIPLIKKTTKWYDFYDYTSILSVKSSVKTISIRVYNNKINKNKTHLPFSYSIFAIIIIQTGEFKGLKSTLSCCECLINCIFFRCGYVSCSLLKYKTRLMVMFFPHLFFIGSSTKKQFLLYT